MSTSFEPGHDFPLALSAGTIKDFKHASAFGHNSDLTTGVEALVWDGPTAGYVFPSDAGEGMEVVSSDAVDTQNVLIQALDQDWNEVDVVAALTGTTPVALPGTLSRVNRVVNIDGTETQGDVTVRKAGGGTVYAIASALEQISTQLVFSVPAGFNAKLETSLLTLNKSGGSSVAVVFRYRRRPYGGVFATGARFGLSKNGTSALSVVIEGVQPLGPKSDVILMAKADSSSTDVSARLPFTLYKV